MFFKVMLGLLAVVVVTVVFLQEYVYGRDDHRTATREDALAYVALLALIVVSVYFC